jgi:hypothetical protein
MPRNRTLRHRQGVLIVEQGDDSQPGAKCPSEAARGQQKQIELFSKNKLHFRRHRLVSVP